MATEKTMTKIQKVMEFRNLKARDLAKRTGLLKGNISLIINGKQTNMHISTLKKLCIALRCKSVDILGW